MAAAAASNEVSLILTQAKRLEVVRLAWELGNDLEAADNTGHRAIHLAARDGMHDIISFLAEKGANLNSKTNPRADYRGDAVEGGASGDGECGGDGAGDVCRHAVT